MLTEKITPRNKQRLLLSVIVLIFALPFGASWFIFNFTEIGKGDVSGSYGELVMPPVQLADIEFSSISSGGASGHLHGKWNLIYIAGADCDSPCRSRLDDMMVLRINLGKDTARLQLLVGTLSAGPEHALREFLQTYAGERILFLPGDRLTAILQDYTLETGRLYLVDPLGNIMMRYSSTSDTEGIIRDLKRLLRYSRIG